MPEFYGNMGSPESVSDYKNYYGAWPPGLDDSIAPLALSANLNDEQLHKIARLYLGYRDTVQWYEVRAALKRAGFAFRPLFERVRALNGGTVPTKLTPEEFQAEYGCPGR